MKNTNTPNHTSGIGSCESPCSASFKKTVIRVEVISDGYWEWDNLSDVAHDITEGECSGTVEVEDVVFLSKEDTASALVAQGSDPSFLLGEEWDGCEPNSTSRSTGGSPLPPAAGSACDCGGFPHGSHCASGAKTEWRCPECGQHEGNCPHIQPNAKSCGTGESPLPPAAG